MSDLHGQYDLYKSMLKKIYFSESDTLYILGDVIDRGAKPLEILFDMMEYPNIKPILGNHEYRMLHVLSHGDISSFKQAQIRSEDDELMCSWLYDGGSTTITEYSKLSSTEKANVLKYLNTFQITEALTLGDHYFFLSHTAPNRDEIQDLSKLTVNDFTWGEIEYDKRYFEDGYLVTGHTPTFLINKDYRGRINKSNGHICIDCGVYFTGQLGCICLDTFEEYYVSRWEGYDCKEIVKELAAIDKIDASKPLYEIFQVNPKRFSKVPFEGLELSTRAFNCLNHYLNPPLVGCTPGIRSRDSISDLLNMSINEYENVRNLGINAFAEVIEKLVFITKGIIR